MKRIENDSFYEFIKKYDPDSQYHFVGEVDSTDMNGMDHAAGVSMIRP